MKRPRLTHIFVQKAKAPGLYGDGLGLYLNVGATGGKSWILRYMIQGKARSMGLGGVVDVSLSLAREAAARHRAAIKQGTDPLEIKLANKAKRQSAVTITFAEAAKQYIDTHKPGWKNAKHGDQWANTIKAYVEPHIGRIDVAQIETTHIINLLENDALWTSKNETATRVRGRIEKVLDWTTVRGYRNGLNPARWKGHLDALLVAPAKIQKTTHFAALPYSQTTEFMADLKAMAGTAARAVEFTILTAGRSGEIRGARWDEIDFEQKLWTIPGSRMKMAKEHRVPLSDAALAVLANMHAQESGLVFPGTIKNGEERPLSDMSLTAVLRRMKRTDITVHGFRSTFRDWTAEQTDYPREVAEMALAHSIGNQVEAAYRRGDLLEKRKQLMADWAAYISGTEKATA